MLLNKDNDTLTLDRNEYLLIQSGLARYMAIMSHFGAKSEEEWKGFYDLANDFAKTFEEKGELQNGKEDSSEKSTEEKIKEVVNDD